VQVPGIGRQRARQIRVTSQSPVPSARKNEVDSSIKIPEIYIAYRGGPEVRNLAAKPPSNREHPVKAVFRTLVWLIGQTVVGYYALNASNSLWNTIGYTLVFLAAGNVATLIFRIRNISRANTFNTAVTKGDIVLVAQPLLYEFLVKVKSLGVKLTKAQIQAMMQQKSEVVFIIMTQLIPMLLKTAGSSQAVIDMARPRFDSMIETIIFSADKRERSERDAANMQYLRDTGDDPI